MFYSFYVNFSDRDYLCFLWFVNNDFIGLIVEYWMNVYFFGVVLLFGVVNFCLY